MEEAKLRRIISPAAQYLRSEAVRGGIDLLMFGYRSHLAKADAALAAEGIGRAHHRVLYVVARRPGESVNTLLDTLGITKQALHRVSVDLTNKDLLEKRQCSKDGRSKLLYLTSRGAELEHFIFERLHENMAQAYADAGEEAVHGFWRTMQHIMDDDAHAHFHFFNAP